MKAKGLKKEFVIQNPTLIAPPTFKTGMFSKKVLNLKEIATELDKNFEEMESFGKNLVPG